MYKGVVGEQIMITKKKMSRKPVILLTGYLGAGKTTVMNELLKNQEAKKLAVIVNDMGAVNIDASLIKKSSMSSYDTEMVELQNGCICCTLQEEFMSEIERISKIDGIEGVLVEASGISNPDSIAQGFMMYEEAHPRTSVYLNSVVTVVDADRIYSEFLDELEEYAEESKEVEECDAEDDPDIINLIIDQIEFCNVILLNKCDLLPRQKLDAVKKVIRQLQPEAEIIETVQGKVDADLILKHRRFDYEKVKDSSLVSKALIGEHREGEIHDEYGITSFVYENKKPFDYDKFMDLLENTYPEELIRAKGYIWFADDPIHVQLFEQAGRNASVTEVSNWVAALPKEEQEHVFENYPDVKDDWDIEYGDRMNQIVFIGRKYNKETIIGQLEACLAE